MYIYARHLYGSLQLHAECGVGTVGHNTLLVKKRKNARAFHLDEF